MSYKYVRTIFIGYLVIIFIGAVLLSLPFSHIGNLRFIDAIFTSTSAACVTGLIVTSTSENFTVIGEIIILMLIQIGGIGYMSLVIIFFLFVKDNLSLDDKRATKLSLDLPDLHVGVFIKKILLVVLTVETLGALILAYQFSEKYELSEAIWYGIFNSISAFNNAGFSLFTDNMIGYKDNTIVLFTICFLIILGGLGYFVIIELHENKKFAKRITIHTKIVIIGTIFLILFGMILFLSIEWSNPKSFGELSIYDKLLNSFFLSVNFRTAGFNSIDLSGLKDSSLFFSTLLMMTGAGQGGTAGGMKITTIAILVIMVLFVLKQSNQEPHVFKRTIEQKLINKATAVVNDEDDNNPDTPDDKKDGDKPTVSIVATDAIATEGTTDTATFTISQTNLSDFDTTVDAKLTLNELERADISKVEYTDANGVKVELTPTQIDALLAGTFEVVIPAGSTGKPSFTITATDDDTYEKSEAFAMEISNPENATLGAGEATAVVNDKPNEIPTTTDDKVITNEDTPITLKLSDFGTYNDTNGDNLSSIKINTLPTNGVLTLDGVLITAATILNVSDINDGKLVFTPNSNTDVDSSFTFQVNDGKDWSLAHTTTLEVIAVADMPTATIDIEFVKEISVSNVCTTSQDLGNLIAYLNNQSNVSADQVVALLKDQNGNPIQDQYNLELTSLGVADLLLYDNTSNQNSTRDINDIDLTDTTALSESSLTVVTNTINNTYNMTTNKVLFEGNIIQNGNIIGTTGNDVIIVKGEIQGGSNINSGAGNDLITILGNIADNQPAIDGGNGVDILYLSKPASHYYFSDIHFHDNLDGHIVDKDTGKTLTFNNIEGIAFGDGTGINCQTTTSSEYQYSIDISAALTDTDGSETLTVTITNVPTGATLSSSSYTLVDNGDNTWNVTIPAGTKSIADTITMSMPTLVDNINLGITARSTEANNNENGLNYKEATDNDAIPTSTNDTVAIYEDNNYALRMSDFGAYSSDVIVVKIETLPTNGVLLLSGVPVVIGQEINKSDIELAKLVFEPIQNSDADSSFTFKVSDGTSWSNGTYETKMNIIAVADEPTVTVNLKSSITIDDTNVTDTSGGYKVSAFDTRGNPTTISVVSNTSHDGFGVSGASSGDSVEIGYNSRSKSSEELRVSFTNDVSKVDVSFAWKHAGETALIKFYRDGILVGTQSHKGGSDTVDAPVTFAVASGVAFDEIRFSAPGIEDDYLIHSISFTEVEADDKGKIIGYLYDVDLSAALVDTDGSETLTVKISGVPVGATFDSTDIVDKGAGVWELTIPSGSTSIIDSFRMTVPTGDDFALKVVATSTESSNLSTATTDILSINDSDTIDLSSFSSNTSYKNITDVVDMTNTKTNIMSIDIKDIVDLVDADKQLVIKGDLEDKVTLDTPSDWSNAGQEQLDGVNYNVYTGTGVNSTIKLLIEDEIDVKPDI